MFSLIIVLVSIALVVALVAATIYYGGSSSAKAAARAAAATLVNQANQINAAGTIAVSQGAGWPAASPQFAQPYLASMPIPPQGAYADSAVAPTNADWTYFLSPSGLTPSRHFVLKNKISREVCFAVNKDQNFIGIPAVWDGTSSIQCFGAGASTGAGASVGYTFFFAPMGTTTSETQAALDQSKAEAGSTIPGYPRLCPDGSSITTGVCVAGDSPALPVVPVDTGGADAGYHLIPSDVFDTAGLTLYGDGFTTFCSPDAPPGSMSSQSQFVVAGIAVPLLSQDDFYSFAGSQCFVVAQGIPAQVEGNYPMTLTNLDGSVIQGTLEYVAAIGPSPIVLSLSPTHGPFEVETTIMITGTGFTPEATAVAVGGHKLRLNYIDSAHLQVVMLKGLDFGTDPEWYISQAQIVIRNPGSAGATMPNGDEVDYVFDAALPPPDTRPPGPAVSSITPATGEYYSATPAVVRGAGFLPSSTMFIGEQEVAVTYVDANTLNVVIPARGENHDDLYATIKDFSYGEIGALNSNTTMSWVYFSDSPEVPSDYFSLRPPISVFNPGTAPGTTVFQYKSFAQVVEDSLTVQEGSTVRRGEPFTVCAADPVMGYHWEFQIDSIPKNVAYTTVTSGSCFSTSILGQTPLGQTTLRVRVLPGSFPQPGYPGYSMNVECPNCRELKTTIVVTD